MSRDVLPRGWSIVPLGELGEWYGGGTPSKGVERFWANGVIPWVSPKDMKALHISETEDHISAEALSETNLRTFPPETVLVVVRSGILSRTLPVAVSLVEAAMNQDLKGVYPFEGIDPGYLAYFLMAEEQDILAKCSKHGTTVASIESSALKGYTVRLAPTKEQRRIVAKVEELLSHLDAGGAALERVRANLKRYRAAVLKAAVEGALTEEWRAAHPDTEPASKLLGRILAERRRKWENDQLARFTAADKARPNGWQGKHAEPTPPDTSDLPQLPPAWCWARVEQVGEVQLGRQRSPKNRSAEYPTKYIRAANITEEGLDLHDVFDMDFHPKEQETYRLQVGDIVLSEASGSPDQVGKPAVWRGEIEGCCFQNTVIRLRPVGVSPDYLLTVFRHFYFNKVFARTAAGVGINHLSAAKFAALALPLPPEREQQEIVALVEQRLSVIAAAEDYVDASSKRAGRLRQSILKEAFAGRLVPQDPADEPASVLLNRIRQARTPTGSTTAIARPARSRNRPLRQKRLFEGPTNGED